MFHVHTCITQQESKSISNNVHAPLEKKKKDASFIYFGLNFSHTYSYMYELSTFGFDVLSTVVYTPVLH